MGNTLGILVGKDCTVNGCWLGVVNAVSIGYEQDHLKVTLEVMVDEDGLDRLKEYSVIETVMGEHNDGNKGNKSINTDD